MSIFEYDEEREMRLIRADEREIGHNEGLIEGMTKGISKGREEATRTNALEFINFDLKQNIAEDIILHKVTAIFGFSNETAKQLLSPIRFYNKFLSDQSFLLLSIFLDILPIHKHEFVYI